MGSEITSLPPMAPFPEAAWRNRLVPDEWEACLDSWIKLAGAHITLSNADFLRISSNDGSLPRFLSSYAADSVLSHDASFPSNVPKAKQLRKLCFLLSHRLLELSSPPKVLLDWAFLADTCRLYGPKNGKKLGSLVLARHLSSLESSLTSIKSSLTNELVAGLDGNLKFVETQLKRLNHLLYTLPETAAFFLAGSDFLDSLIICYKLINPAIRKIIISTTYLCFLGPIYGEKLNFSLLIDQLYSLEAAATAHKPGSMGNDSLVAGLVTATPILTQIKHQVKESGLGSSRADSVLSSLEGFRKPGTTRRSAKRNIDKGKGIASHGYGQSQSGKMHIHRMSLITQVQDLFPDFGSGFVVRLLDEYSDDVEQVIAHLLEDSLPPYLQTADRSEKLDPNSQPTARNSYELAPGPSPSGLPSRRNIFDDDEFDNLAINAAKLHFGRRNPDQTADDVLEDKSTGPSKAAILAALAAFDSDDDERDDTYDVADVGGTVDSATPGNNPEEINLDAHSEQDEVLFKAYKSNPESFNRDAATRRDKARVKLRTETGMTDEAIEGWGLMLSRDPRQMRRLEAKLNNFTGAQQLLASTSWRVSPAGSGTEESDFGGNNRGKGGFLRGQLRGGRGRGRGRGNVAGPAGEADTEMARRHKEANKGSRANHNRKDQRDRKMARGGFPS